MNKTLQQFMDNLYQAGMSIESVVEHGFDFACKQGYYDATEARAFPIEHTTIQLEASNAVLAVADAMEVSLKWQMKISRERG